LDYNRHYLLVAFMERIQPASRVLTDDGEEDDDFDDDVLTECDG
jgi:hypothetical protein